MALGLNTEAGGGGDFLPIIKYDGRAGRFFRVDRFNNGSGWETDQDDISQGLAFVADLENIEVGWIAFAATGPDFQMVRLGEKMPDKPTDGHKQGFRVRVLLAKSAAKDGSAEDVREFSSTAKVVLGPMDALHSAYADAPEAKAGKLPVVQVGKIITVKTDSPAGQTTNYSPTLEIVKWVDRPACLSARGAKPTASAQQPRTASAPPATGSGHAAPPVTQAAPPPAAQAAPAGIDDAWG